MTKLMMDLEDDGCQETNKPVANEQKNYIACAKDHQAKEKSECDVSEGDLEAESP